MKIVTAEIVTLRTNLYFSMDIGERPEDVFRSFAFWEKTDGALNLGDEAGSWLWKTKSSEVIGINLFALREDRHYWESVALATLYDVPQFFFQSMNCGGEYSGEGVIHKTNETVAWRMYFPCV